MAYQFGKRSQEKLIGVHPKLVQVLNRAIQNSSVDFSIIEGLRTLDRQKQLLKQGATQTLNSKHLKQSTGYGHAVDVAPYPLSWDLEKFYPIAEAIQKSAKALGIRIRWGGSWEVLNELTVSTKQSVLNYSAKKRALKQKAFIDAPHFEIVL